MEWFNANVGPFQSALEKAPEIFESVSMDLSVNVPFRVVNDFVLIASGKKRVGCERIGVQCAASGDVIFYFSVDGVLFTVRNNRGANLTAAFKNPVNGVLPLFLL